MKQKQRTPCAAGELYTSPLFRARRATVERTCDSWFILSALHGLLRPHAIVAPYELSLASASSAERRIWARQVVDELRVQLVDLTGVRFDVHAGALYWADGLADSLAAAGATVTVPTKGLGIGQQLKYYASQQSTMT